MQEQYNRLTKRNRIIVGFSIITIIALMHIFRVGSYLHGDLYLLYYSYVSDLIIPFGFYFLLCINELTIKILQKWYVKASFIIGITALVEILQLLGIYALGITFDPIDILMYALGVGIAVIFDRYLFKRFIPFWDLEKQKENIGKK
ncbi:MAG: hypothetical protein IQL11_07370 [Bacteroidales bacterium]|jgi:hypothetical protein|nr:hypothetical protein [Bacteroidales bacterium]